MYQRPLQGKEFVKTCLMWQSLVSKCCQKAHGKELCGMGRDTIYSLNLTRRLTKYFVRLGIPWSVLDSEAHKAFWREENPKYFLKHSTTFSKGKLPLLYKQVKAAVDSKIQREMVH